MTAPADFREALIACLAERFNLLPEQCGGHADAILKLIAEPTAENEQLRRALGCHMQADAYRETLPDSEEDAAGLRKSETWWRLMARCAIAPESDLADACGSAALQIPEVVAQVEAAVAAARAGLKERSQP